MTTTTKEPEERTCADGCNGCEDCTDYDEDCDGVEDKVNCWIYAPERGMCPYLRAKGPE